MKLTRVEQAFDGSRLVFYFTADGRVDFRELVRELAAEFRTRIEMRQIGVRDEAKMYRRLRHLRPPAVLHDVPAVVRAGLDQDGQAAGPEPEPVEAVRPLRPPEVLPALRAAERQGCACTAAAAAKAAATIPSGCGSGGCGSGGCGIVRLRIPERQVRKSATCSSTQLEIRNPHETARRDHRRAIRPASARKSPRSAAADARVLEVCEPIVYAPPDGAVFAAGRAERRGRTRRVRHHRPRGGRCAARRGARRSPRRRSTRKRSGWPACRGAATPICSRT